MCVRKVTSIGCDSFHACVGKVSSVGCDSCCELKHTRGLGTCPEDEEEVMDLTSTVRAYDLCPRVLKAAKRRAL